jgi:hypothetical protein
MKRLRRSLQSISKNLRALTEKAEKMTKALDRLDKAQVKAVPRKKAVAKKTALKAVAKKTAPKAVAKEIAPKRVSAKKVKSTSATEKVLRIIVRSKKGVDTATLKNQTGYNSRKIWDIVHRAYKEGKIKKVGRGTYAKT